MKHTVKELVGKPNAGVTAVTLQIFVSDDEFIVRGEGLYPNLTYTLKVFGQNEYGHSHGSYAVEVRTEGKGMKNCFLKNFQQATI